MPNARYQRDAEAYLRDKTDSFLIDMYRLDKEGILHFSSLLDSAPNIKPKTKAGLSPLIQLLVALRFYATGSSLKSLLDTGSFNLSHGSVYNCIVRVSLALRNMIKSEVDYPFDANVITSIKQGFFEYGGFPGVMGAIDGTMIKIKAPSVREDIYVGRKTDGHYLNIQFICDSNLTFLDAVIKWPGSVNDKTMWSMCGLKPRLESYIQEQGPDYRGWLLGDSGYNQRRTMMIPLLEPQTDKEIAYNTAHKKCRCSVERAIGVLKSRFRCLCKQTGGGIQFDVKICCDIIAACTVLHNYCRKRNIAYDIAADVAATISQESSGRRARSSSNTNEQNKQDQPEGQDGQQNIGEEDVVEGNSARRSLIDEFF